MALKPTLTGFEFAALPDVIKSEYKVQADGSYKLDLGGFHVLDKDPTALMNALEFERNEHKQTKSKFDEIARERDEAKKAAELAKLQKEGDLDALKKFFTEQQEQQRLQFESQVKAQMEQVERQKQAAAEQYRKTKAMELATELFGQKAPILLPAIMQNIAVKVSEFGAEPTVEFLGDNGTPILGATKETFKQKFLTDPLYKDMIVVSHASGGSANESTANVSSLTQEGKPKRFDDYSSGDLVELLRTNPNEYNRLKALRYSK
jgi:hypothetical protein